MGDSEHLDDDTALAYASGTLPEERRAIVEAHLDVCAACRRLVSELARGPESDREPPAFATPEKVGRFLVLGLVGVGGMGAVYAAYDPELDRKVAIKLLHRRSERLLAEGKAMASLMHPNVVAVYDVGMHGDVPFIAMEYVDGKSLRDWLAVRKRSPKEILAVAVEAGRGLAAAHAAGLVHRDFKPDNVLITEGGHAKVTDFGLALRGEGATSEISGTPAYMSPEQRAGKAVDARSDQYGFAVTVAEALFGTRPEPGRPLRIPSNATVIDGAIKRAITRALATEPSDRFPSMDALLDAIVKAPRRRRRRIVTALAGVLSLAAIGLVIQGVQERRNACASAGEGARRAWSAGARQAVRSRFGSSVLAFAPGALAAVERTLDAYAAELEAEEREVCVATKVRRDVSEEALALRAACLRHRDVELRAMAELLADADDAVIENAAVAVSKLTPIAACRSDVTLAMQPLPPSGGAAALEVERIRNRLAEAKAALESGRYGRGLEIAEACVKDAERTGYLPVQAEALFVEGSLRDATSETTRAEEALARAAELAETSRHDELAARARVLLVWVIGYRSAQHEIGHALESAARGAVMRAGTRADLMAPLENNVGTLLWAEGRYGPAGERFERAQSLWEEVYGPEHPLVADALNNRGLVQWNAGDLEAALASHERALAIRTKLLGPEHPSVASSLNNLGLVEQDLGRFEEARAHHRRAVEIQTSTHGELHPLVASAWNNLGLAELGLGEDETALGSLFRGYEIRRATLGTVHPDVANSLVNLALAKLALQKHAEARAHLEDARRIQIGALGPSHASLVDTLTVDARLLRAEGRPKEAAARAAEAVALAESVLGAEHPAVFAARAEEGAALLALGRVKDAMDRLRSVVARSEKLADSLVVGTAALTLCEAMLRSEAKRPEPDVVEVARRRLRAAGARGRAPLARLERLVEGP